jgi:hypothetical protein
LKRCITYTMIESNPVVAFLDEGVDPQKKSTFCFEYTNVENIF